MAKRLKKQLSDDAKIARIENWALKLGLDPKATSAALTEKYGLYAYEIMEKVMMTPVVAVREAGGQVRNSKDAAEYFMKHHIPEEKLALVLGKDVKTIEAEIKAYHEANPKPEETPEQKEIRERQEQFNSHFNDEMKRGDNTVEKTVDPEQTDISRMTLEDYAKYCRPEDKPAADYNDLAEKAFEDFGKGEGIVPYLYLDAKGYPTIGNGHLVLHPDVLNDKKRLDAYRDVYIKTPLVGANGKPLTEAQKNLQFSQIEFAMRNGTFKTSGGCPNKVLVPMTGKLNDEGMKYLFKKDFKYTYDTTKRVVPNIDKMPLPVQLAVLHTTFAYGNANRLKKVDVNSPAEVMERVDQLRNRRGTSRGERATIDAANDSIKTARNNYIAAQKNYILEEHRRSIQKMVDDNRIDIVVPRIEAAPSKENMHLVMWQKNSRGK